MSSIKTKKQLYGAILIALAISLLTLLAGCSSNGGNTQTSGNGSEQATAETPAVGAPGEIQQGGQQLTLSPPAGVPSTDIKASGQGFKPGEQVVLTLNDEHGSINLGAVTADSTGSFADTVLKLPDSIRIGQYVVGATGLQSAAVAQSVFRVRQDGASIDLDKYTGRPGLPLGIKGSGFAPGETVIVFFEDAPNTPIGQVIADDLGRINSTDLQLPFVSEGTHKLIALGQDSQVKVDASFIMFGFHPWVNLDPYALAPGASMDLSGNGFIPGETIRVYLDNKDSEPLLSLEADWAGNFIARNAFVADVNSVGQHQLIVVGDKSNEETSYPFQVAQFYPNVDLVPYAGSPGTKVTVSGQGFAPNETIRVFLGDGDQKTEVLNFQADKDGFIRNAGEFVIDYGAQKGDLPVTVVGDSSKSPVVRNFGVLVMDPWISLSDYAGIVGKQVTIKGGGFGTGETISIFVGSEKAASITADANGEFQGAGPVTIVSNGGSTVNIVASGDLTGSKASAQYTVIKQ